MDFSVMINQFKMNPRRVFLFDGIGAFISALMLGVVLVRFSEIIGLDVSTLILLASFPCIFALYDFLCYFFVNKSYSRFIIIIAISNLLYCVLSIGLAFYHVETITLIGWTYIIIEVIIVLVISIMEYQISKSIK
jgi:hypothetical protein